MIWEQLAHKQKTALVLAGGGARGAYEVGAIQALAELGFEPDLVAGTSIGALNGSIVAQEVDLQSAGEALEAAWHQLGEDDIIRPDYRRLTGDLASAVAGKALKGAQKAAAALLPKLINDKERGYFDTGPIEKLLQRFVYPERIRRGRIFWIAITKLLSNTDFPFRHVVETARAYAAKDVEYIEPRSLRSDDEMLASLLASAAIPGVFPSQKVGKRKYLDGGIVDNVPVQGIRNRGCGLIVVVHLSNGSVWDRRRFDELNILEIRPSAPVQRNPGFPSWLHSLIDFQPERIESLRRMGHQDARRIVEDLKRTVELHATAKRGRAELLDSTKVLMDDAPLGD